jgi:hypothetical protein
VIPTLDNFLIPEEQEKHLAELNSMLETSSQNPVQNEDKTSFKYVFGSFSSGIRKLSNVGITEIKLLNGSSYIVKYLGRIFEMAKDNTSDMRNILPSISDNEINDLKNFFSKEKSNIKTFEEIVLKFKKQMEELCEEFKKISLSSTYTIVLNQIFIPMNLRIERYSKQDLTDKTSEELENLKALVSTESEKLKELFNNLKEPLSSFGKFLIQIKNYDLDKPISEKHNLINSILEKLNSPNSKIEITDISNYYGYESNLLKSMLGLYDLLVNLFNSDKLPEFLVALDEIEKINDSLIEVERSYSENNDKSEYSVQVLHSLSVSMIDTHSHFKQILKDIASDRDKQEKDYVEAKEKIYKIEKDFTEINNQLNTALQAQESKKAA